MVTQDFKKRVVKAVNKDRLNYPTASKQAITLGINASQLSVIAKGKLDNVVSEAKWLSIGRRLDVPVKKEQPWKAAETPTFLFVYEQLSICQKESTAGIIVDDADTGKTFTAREYCKENINAVYIDASQVKSRQKFVRSIAKEFGINHTSTYNNVYADLVYYLQSCDTPLVVIDEAGDLAYDAFLEIKALWNATELNCGWFLIGADGLKAKVKRRIELEKVGYTEIFSRFGGSYQKSSPEGAAEKRSYNRQQFALILKANSNKNYNQQELYARLGGSLRKLRAFLKHNQ